MFLTERGDSVQAVAFKFCLLIARGFFAVHSPPLRPFCRSFQRAASLLTVWPSLSYTSNAITPTYLSPG